MLKRFRNQRGAALLETAITIPLVLLVTVSRSSSSAAPIRPGRSSPTRLVRARASSVLPDSTRHTGDRRRSQLSEGRKPPQVEHGDRHPRTDGALRTEHRLRITVMYAFDFTVLNPVVRSS